MGRLTQVLPLMFCWCYFIPFEVSVNWLPPSFSFLNLHLAEETKIFSWLCYVHSIWKKSCLKLNSACVQINWKSRLLTFSLTWSVEHCSRVPISLWGFQVTESALECGMRVIVDMLKTWSKNRIVSNRCNFRDCLGQSVANWNSSRAELVMLP